MNNKKYLGIAVFIITLIAAAAITFYKNQNSDTSSEPAPTVEGAEATYDYDSSSTEEREPRPFENNPEDDPALTYEDLELAALMDHEDTITIYLSSQENQYIGQFYLLPQEDDHQFAYNASLESLPEGSPEFYQGWVSLKSGDTQSLGKIPITPIGSYVLKGRTNIDPKDIGNVFITRETQDDSTPETRVLIPDANLN